MINDSKIKSRVIGIDINVNQTTLAVVDNRGNIIAKDYFSTSDYSDVNNYITALSDHIVMLAEANGG